MPVPEQGEWILLYKNNVDSLYLGYSFLVADAKGMELASVRRVLIRDSSLWGKVKIWI